MRKQPILIAALVTLGLAACETTSGPSVALLASTASTPIGTTSLVITPSLARLPVGGTIQLATNALPGVLVQWESLRPDIATVTQNGFVTAGGLGIATIRARLFADTNNVAAATIEVVFGGFIP